MQENIILPNPEYTKDIEEKMISDGSEKLQIIADFDNTLTYAHDSEGKRIPSMISLLRDGNYISKEYAEKAHELYNKYHPIEIDKDVSDEEKTKAMKKWWTEHFNLLINSGLKKNYLEEIAKSGRVKLREGIPEMINYLHEKNIPLVIISSSGVGEALEIFLENQNLFYKNIHLITNFYKWDDKDNATGINEPIIHGGNKDETSLREIPKLYSKLESRKNIILLGDNISDIKMERGSNYKNLLKIGFLNENIDENMNEYKNSFDIVITNDSNANYLNNLVRKIN